MSLFLLLFLTVFLLPNSIKAEIATEIACTEETTQALRTFEETYGRPENAFVTRKAPKLTLRATTDYQDFCYKRDDGGVDPTAACSCGRCDAGGQISIGQCHELDQGGGIKDCSCCGSGRCNGLDGKSFNTCCCNRTGNCYHFGDY